MDKIWLKFLHILLQNDKFKIENLRLKISDWKFKLENYKDEFVILVLNVYKFQSNFVHIPL
jgi:hypothetical protein